METFSLRDFSGGLNTSLDEANIPANMTADLENVDFLDSKAISRRSGYLTYLTAGSDTVISQLTEDADTASSVSGQTVALIAGTKVTSFTLKTGTVTSRPWAYINITSTTGGVPSGRPLAISSRLLSSTKHDITFIVDWVVPSTGTYAFCVFTDGVGTAVWRKNTAGGYASGNELDANHAIVTGDDLYFKLTYGAPIHALSSYYQTDGDNYFAAVCGTAAFLNQYVATESPLARLESDMAVTTGSLTSTTRAWASGGKTQLVTSASCTYQIPYSTAVKVWTNCGTALGASLAMDAAAYVTATGTTYSYSALSATLHTLNVKPATRNTTSLSLVPTNTTTVGVTRNAGTGVVSIKFYDDGTTDVLNGTEVGFRTSATAGVFDEYVVMLQPIVGVYYARINGTDYPHGPARSVGWHTVTFQRGGTLSVDGTVFASVPYTDDDVHVECYAERTSTGTYTAYFDSLTVNGVVIDDMAATTGWTAVAADTDGTYTLETSTAQKDTTDWCEVDCFDYSAIGGFTKVLSTLTASSTQFSFATMNDKLYMSSPYDAVTVSIGATFNAVTASGTATGGFLIEHRRRLFCAGAYNDPALLKYSDLDDAEKWDTSAGGGSIYLAGKDSGGNCTGLISWNNLVHYFSESATYTLDTTGAAADWVARTISKSHGCIAPKSLAAAPNGLIFLSGDGVRSYGLMEGVYSDDGSAFAILSDNITPTLRSYTNAQLSAAVGCVFDNRYYLGIGHEVYVCDLEKRTDNRQPPWTRYTGLDVNCFVVDRADKHALYAGSKTTGIVYRLETGGTDNGTPISMYYKTPPLAPKGYTTVKHWRHTHIAAEAPQSQSLTVTVTTDDISPPAQTVTFDADTDIQPKRLLTSGRGRSAQVEFASDGLAQDLTISELTMTYNPEPRMR